MMGPQCKFHCAQATTAAEKSNRQCVAAQTWLALSARGTAFLATTGTFRFSVERTSFHTATALRSN